MSKELAKTYDPSGLEDRLYKKWEENGYFHVEVDRSKKPFTIVMPPPNITGQLHMAVSCFGQYHAGYFNPIQENAGIQCFVAAGN